MVARTWVGGNGGGSTDWFRKQNWNPNDSVPTAADSVTIGTTTNSPTIAGQAAPVLTLTMNGTDTLTIGTGGSLSVAGTGATALSIGASATITMATGTSITDAGG